MLVAFITIFLDLLGFGIVIPIQAFYAESFGASAAVVTLLGASYSAMQFLFAPFWGRLSDRVGRRPIVLSSVLLSGVGHAAFGLAPSLAFLFAARMLAGFGNANIGTAQAIISDVTTPETRAKGMGLIGAAFGLGFIFGPAFGGWLSQYSPTAPSFAAAGLAAVNFLLALRFLPETRRETAAPKHTLSIAAFRHAARHLNVRPILMMTLVVTIGFAMMEHTVGLFIEHTWLGGTDLTPEARIKTAARLTAYFLVAVGLTATIVQGGLIGRLQRRFGEVVLVRAGVVLLAVGLATLPVFVGAVEIPILLLCASLLALGSGLLNPSASSLLSRSVGPEEQGSVFGLNQSLSALGRVIGPGVAGYVFEVSRAGPFYTGAALLCGAVVITLGLRPPQA
jgi:multidrug resistance protein